MKKKIKRSTLVSVALLIYITACAVYFLPRNTQISDKEKYITLAASYVIVFVLWIVLRKKEQMERRRKEEDESNHLKK